MRYPLVVLTGTLENEVHVAQALFFPEVTRLGHKSARPTRKLGDSLVLRLKNLYGHDLFQRLPPSPIQEFHTQVTLRPRQCDSPIHLEFFGVAFERSPGLWLAYLPELDIAVQAADRHELSHHAPAHVVAELMRRDVTQNLQALAELQRCRRLTISELELDFPPRSLKQVLAEKKDKKPRPVLASVATDLTAENLTRAYERTREVEQLADLLKGNRSVLLVGPAGCGKTAVFRELVRRRPELQLGSTPFFETSGARLMSGQHAFGMWQDRCQRLVLEASRKRAIVHLGNLSELCQVARHSTNPFGMAGFFRGYVQRGDLLAVSECTPEQWVLLERDQPQLLEAFARLEIRPPGPEEGLSILLQCALDWSEQQGPPLEAVEQVDRLHRRYATYSAYPGRPLRFLRNLLRRYPEPSAPQVSAAFSEETGLPRVLIDDTRQFDKRRTRAWFEQRVLGQAEAVESVVERLAAIKTALSRPQRPIASFLMVGPTGVGKTEMARALAEFLFRDSKKLVRLDMSEYSDAWAVQRLVGDPGVLTSQVREHPFAVVLFDELEKAHPDFFDLLLQVLGEARLTDAAGRQVDFTNMVVLMTSNLGAEQMRRGGIGIRSQSQQLDWLQPVRAAFRPEFFNRIDRVLPFAPLEEEVILDIARRELGQIQSREGIRGRPLELSISPETAEWLTRHGHDRRYGARPLKRAIERELLAPLAASLNLYPPEVPLAAHIEPGIQVKLIPLLSADRARHESERALSLADRISEVRRQCRQLWEGPFGIQLRNDHEVLRRQATPKGPPPATQKLVDRVQKLVAQSEKLEEKALLGLGQHDVWEAEPCEKRRQALSKEFDQLLITLYGRLFNAPDVVTVGLYSNLPEAHFFLARAYAALAERHGWKLELMSVLVRKGAVEETLDDPYPQLLRARERLEYLEKPRPGLGVILHVQGAMAYPRLQPEVGHHSFLHKGDRYGVVVHISQQPLTSGRADKPWTPPAYCPPAGIHRWGAPATGKRRLYDLAEGKLSDPFLNLNATGDLHQLVLDCIETRLLDSALKAAGFQATNS